VLSRGAASTAGVRARGGNGGREASTAGAAEDLNGGREGGRRRRRPGTLNGGRGAASTADGTASTTADGTASTTVDPECSTGGHDLNDRWARARWRGGVPREKCQATGLDGKRTMMARLLDGDFFSGFFYF